MSIGDVRFLCVDRFPDSGTRNDIMMGLEAVVIKLRESEIPGELWVDGSFITEKQNPDDVDLVFRFNGESADGASSSQIEILKWFGSNLKTEYRCDSYLIPNFPEAHPNYWLSEYQYAYWMRQWGFDSENNVKGFAVISFGVNDDV